jgi:hypothetical protein
VSEEPTLPLLKRLLRRHPFTAAASSLAMLVTLASVTMDMNLIKFNLGPLEHIEGGEVVQVAASWLLVFVAFRSDQILAARAKALEDEVAREVSLIRVVHVTMRTVRDIVGNCLSELQLLRMEAEGKVSAEAVAIFDESIHVATSKLSSIEDLEAFVEREMALGPGLDMKDSEAGAMRPDPSAGVTPRPDVNDRFTVLQLDEWYRAASGYAAHDLRIRRLIDEIRRLRSERDQARVDPAFAAQISKRQGPRKLPEGNT